MWPELVAESENISDGEHQKNKYMETKEVSNNLIRVVAGVIFNPNYDAILVGQRAQSASHPLKWEFVGGKVENGESPEEALKREVEEETTLKISVGKLLGIAEIDYRNLGRPSHQILFYESKILNGVAKLDPKIYNDIRWVQAENLPNLDWIEADYEFAKKLAAKLTAPIRSNN